MRATGLVVAAFASACGRVAFEPRADAKADAIEIDASSCPADLRLGEAAPSGGIAFAGTTSGYVAVWPDPTMLQLARVSGDNLEVRAKALGTATTTVLPTVVANGDNAAVAWLTPTLNVSIEQPDGTEIVRTQVAAGQPNVSSPALGATLGTYMLVWTDTRSGLSDLLLLPISPTGVFGTIRNIGAPAKTTPAIAGRNDRFLVAYVEQGGISVIAVNALGNVVGGPTQVAANGLAPAVVASGAGFAVAWLEDGGTQQRIVLRELDPGGTPLGPAVPVGVKPGFFVKVAIAWDGARYVIAGTLDLDMATAPGDVTVRIIVEPGGTIVSPETGFGRPSGDTRAGAVAMGPAGARFMAIEPRIDDPSPQAYVMCLP